MDINSPIHSQPTTVPHNTPIVSPNPTPIQQRDKSSTLLNYSFHTSATAATSDSTTCVSSNLPPPTVSCQEGENDHVIENDPSIRLPTISYLLSTSGSSSSGSDDFKNLPIMILNRKSMFNISDSRHTQYDNSGGCNIVTPQRQVMTPSRIHFNDDRNILDPHVPIDQQTVNRINITSLLNSRGEDRYSLKTYPSGKTADSMTSYPSSSTFDHNPKYFNSKHHAMKQKLVSGIPKDEDEIGAATIISLMKSSPYQTDSSRPTSSNSLNLIRSSYKPIIRIHQKEIVHENERKFSNCVSYTEQKDECIEEDNCTGFPDNCDHSDISVNSRENDNAIDDEYDNNDNDSSDIDYEHPKKRNRLQYNFRHSQNNENIVGLDKTITWSKGGKRRISRRKSAPSSTILSDEREIKLKLRKLSDHSNGSRKLRNHSNEVDSLSTLPSATLKDKYKRVKDEKRTKIKKELTLVKNDGLMHEEIELSKKRVGSGTRSRTGCWICRLRKKKCTEERPNCNNCVRLNLECFYDIVKPEFISNPTKKSEKLEEIKRRTKEAKRMAMRKKDW